METSTLGILAFGFFIGLWHAHEADHLAAVATMVSERKSIWSSVMVGGLWGLGHTISLLIAGVFVLLLNFEITETTEKWLEFGVGVMLTLLGLNVLRKLIKGGSLHLHPHKHAGHDHAHPHIHELDKIDEPESHHGLSFSPKSLLVGMIHGLAGSAAVMLVILPTIESKPIGLLYLLIFGAGSIGGMMLMSFLVGLPFQLKMIKSGRFTYILQGLAGLLSMAIGLMIIYEKGFSEGPIG